MNVSTCSDRPILNPCGLQNLAYQVDPYIGCEHYCCYCYALARAETDWTQEVRIHKDIVEQLSAELDKIPAQRIYMGYHTDPYQPCEAEYRQTRQILELFVKKGFSASLLTKSDLVVRDMDILKEMDAASVSASVAFNDDRTRALFEANTMATENRIKALHHLKEGGIRTGALVCPVIPHITDATRLIELLAPCTDVIWIYGLSIEDRRGQNWENTHAILTRHYPDLIDQIEPAIFSKEHTYWQQLRKDLTALKDDRQLNLNIHL